MKKRPLQKIGVTFILMSVLLFSLYAADIFPNFNPGSINNELLEMSVGDSGSFEQFISLVVKMVSYTLQA